MVDGGRAEGTVVPHDRVWQAGRPGMGSEALSSQGVGNRLHSRAERPRCVPWGHLLREGATVLLTDLVGDLLGLGRLDYGQEASQQR